MVDVLAGSVSKSVVLGGSWVVKRGVVCSLVWVRALVAPLVTPVITIHEPPSTVPQVSKPRPESGTAPVLRVAGHVDARTLSPQVFSEVFIALLPYCPTIFR